MVSCSLVSRAAEGHRDPACWPCPQVLAIPGGTVNQLQAPSTANCGECYRDPHDLNPT